MIGFSRSRVKIKRLSNGLIATAFVAVQVATGMFSVASASATANGGNEECPAGTTQLAKYNFVGKSYVAESGGSDVTVTGTASGGTFTVVKANTTVSSVVVKAGDGAKVTSYNNVTTGTFDNTTLTNDKGKLQDISNIKICGTTTTPPVVVDVCPNIEGAQATIPAGLIKNNDGNCVVIPPTCVNASDATYKHTFDGPTGTATVTLAGNLPLCVGQTQDFVLLSYKASGPDFWTNSVPQTLYDHESGTITSQNSTINLSVDVPNCYTQVDLLWGSQYDTTITDAASNAVAYGPRILGGASAPGNRSAGPWSAYNGGTQSCTPPAKGSITVNKAYDTGEGDGFVYSNSDANTLGFAWKLDDTGDYRDMGTTANDLSIGDHSVNEKSVKDYSFVGWFYTNDEGHSCTNPQGMTLPLTLSVTKDHNSQVTLCNQATEKKVTLCHATGSLSNPYEEITISVSGAFHGHLGNSHQDGRDIIPTFTYKGDSYSQNWDATGQEILSNHCVPKGSITIVKDAQPNDAQDFGFTTSGNGLTSFSLDDDDDATLSNTKVFNGLAAGNYTVSETELEGWSLKSIVCNEGATVWTEGNTVSISLNPGQNVTCTFTNDKQSSINGVKFEDTNGNGIFDEGEPTLSGWTITYEKQCEELQIFSRTFSLVPNDDQECPTVKDSTTTDKDGAYSFTDLTPGTYKVCEVNQDGWTQTFPGTNDGCTIVTIEGPNQNETANFGNFKHGSISGYKFNDANANGTLDEGEAKLAGWTITLYNDNDDIDTIMNNIVDTAVTDENGNYSFTNLEAGTYLVCETQQTGWTQVFPTSNNGCHELTIATSGQALTANFGNKKKSIGQVLGTSTTVETGGRGAGVLATTGSSTLVTTFAAMSILGVLGAVVYATRRKVTA